MEIFYLVFFKVISVLLNVVIGFVAGKWLKVERDSIASLLFYFIAPIVFFSIPANTHLDVSSLGIVAITFGLSSILCLVTYFSLQRFIPDQRLNLVAMSAGTANSGYFMLPIAASIFDDHRLSIYMMAIVGINIYESSLGYYICARSMVSVQDSIKKVLKSPTLNAFILGCLTSFAGITIPDFLDDFVVSIRSSFTILGMIIIGLGISTIKRFEIDKSFTALCLVAKFMLYPLVINLFILFDRYVLGWYSPPYHDVLQLVSAAPMAANTIVIASILKVHPERVATSVVISCLVALFYIPTIVYLFIEAS